MAQNATADRRSTDLKQKMAEHFAEFEAGYRDADWCSIVHEDDEKVVIADHRGFEHDEWQSDAAAGPQFSETMHALARQVTDHDWCADYPVVFDKLEDSA